MKVLQILPELNAGGVERGTLEIAAHLVREGHQALGEALRCASGIIFRTIQQ